MGRYNTIKQWIDGLPLLRYAFYPVLDTLRAGAWTLRMPAESRENWRRRTDDVISCPDNAFITRVRGAGSTWRGYQLMHNGVKVHTDSYYGFPVTRMLRKNRGVHEPQEERAFGEVLKYMRPGAAILELGAYWAFYSIWFCQVVPKAKCYLVEPSSEGLESGKRNFQLNGMVGAFQRAYIGSKPKIAPDGVRVATVDEIVAECEIEHVDILHSDIQGYELEMLEGAARTFSSGKIDYVFISTHGDELHSQCRIWLERANYEILAAADLHQTFSFDGLLVARRSDLAGLGPVEISRKDPDGRVLSSVHAREDE